MLVCHCNGVSDRKIRRAIRDGATTPGEIARSCGAGSTCGGCHEGVRKIGPPQRDGKMPFDAYTLYYVGQAVYQVGGPGWRETYPVLRDYLAGSQKRSPQKLEEHGVWFDAGDQGGGRLTRDASKLYATSVACFLLAIPNRYLPILQEGRIESLKGQFRGRP